MRPPPSSVTMAPAWWRLASPEMTPPEQCSPPSLAAPVTRYTTASLKAIRQWICYFKLQPSWCLFPLILQSQTGSDLWPPDVLAANIALFPLFLTRKAPVINQISINVLRTFISSKEDDINFGSMLCVNVHSHPQEEVAWWWFLWPCDLFSTATIRPKFALPDIDIQLLADWKLSEQN